MNLELPPYLQRPVAGAEFLGTLEKEVRASSAHWVIRGDPQVIVMAKRLFPASEGRGPGIAKFQATRRQFVELLWFLQRWPLSILSPEEFERDYQDACEYARNRITQAKQPTHSKPGVSFIGELKSFQQEGLAWVLNNRRTLLADDMGLGKTVQAIAFLATQQKWPALVVPQPHLIRHWGAKLEQFLGAVECQSAEADSGVPTYHVLRGTKKKADIPHADIYIIHYRLLSAWRADLKNMDLQAVIFDEIQELRHSGTEKYSAASDIASGVEFVLGMSGTPIYNYGGEIWNVLNIIDYHCLGDWDAFTREWCHGYGNVTVKDSAVLGAHLRREGLMLRRRKEDVLQELPPKRRIVEYVDSNDTLFYELVSTAVQTANDALHIEDRFERGRAELEAFNATRQATGIAKAISAAVFIRGLLDAGEPVLVFAHHHAVMDVLMEELRDKQPVRISGRENEKEKWDAQEKFRTGATNLCLISLRSATGIDGLQERVRAVVFAELDWSPAVHSQAEDRGHRTGLKDSLLCYYLVTSNGTDPDMQEALGLKISQFLGLMGDAVQSHEDTMLADAAARDHVKRIMEKLRAMSLPKCGARTRSKAAA